MSGFRPACATTGAVGLDRALSEPWNAVAVDLHLPDIPRLVILERLRDAHVHYPVIAMTGWYFDDETEPEARRLGAGAFMWKPVDCEQLAIMLAKLIEASPQQVPDTSAGSFPLMRGRGTARHTPVHDMPSIGDLHRQAANGDQSANDEIDRLLLPILERRLRRAFRAADPDVLSEAAEDALLEYRREPRRFDASRNTPLTEYLVLIASHDVLNRLEAERRRSVRARTYQDFVQSHRKTYDAIEIEPRLQRELAIDDVVDSLRERQAARLWLQGERHSAPLAQVLGLSDLPVSQARSEVKRFKDRLRQALSRWHRTHT